MKALKILILSTLTILSYGTYGQLDLSYTAEKMDTSINSAYSEVAPVFSPDGLRMYFVRINHPENRFGSKGSQDIWYSDKVGTTWTSAVRLPNTVNLGRYNALYYVTEAGELIINGIYDYKQDFLKRGLSMVKPNGDDYSHPVSIKVKNLAKKSDGAVASVGFDKDHKKMFLSFSKARYGKKNSIYMSHLKNDSWTSPKKMKGINSKKSDEAPFLSMDGTTLYFSSNRDNEGKNFDIYSSQTADINEYKEWAEPEKVLGDVSKGDFESFFVLGPKEEYAYFSSVRDGSGKADIYKLQVKDVRKYILLKGFVINDKTGEKMSNETPFTLKVISDSINGTAEQVELDGYRQVADSTFFEFKLPFGAKYNMIASIEDYDDSPVAIDLTGIDAYQVMNLDAKVTPIPVMDLDGKIEFVDFDPEIMSYDSIEIYANDELVENAVINSDGTYTLSLPTGQLYKIEAHKKGYLTFPIEIDVINDHSKISRTADLKIERVPDIYSFLHTKVRSRKDSSYLRKEDYMVYIDGQPAPFGFVNKTEEGFDMSLEMGKKYFIMLKSHDYIEAHDSVDFRKAKVRQRINKDFYLVPIEVGATVQIEHIYFDLGKAKLRPESFVELDRLVELLEEHDHLVIEVSGHTDNKGNAYLNKKLSGERALAVKSYLVEKGIPSDRMTSKGYGFDKPVVANDTEINRSKNRRVEFTILSND